MPRSPGLDSDPVSSFALPLIGPSGEPVDFIATINGHGVASLPPNQSFTSRLRTTIRLANGDIRTVELGQGEGSTAEVTVLSTAPTSQSMVLDALRHMLKLDQDLSCFYGQTISDPLLAWVGAGFGRMMRCQTVYEDVIKTILTTNCAWSATIRMTERLVGELGDPDPGFAAEPPFGRAFPTPDAMATRDETFYREVVRAGYRAPHLVKLSRAVAAGELDLERLSAIPLDEMDDLAMEKELLALPGVGPYAAAHIMHMLGRSSKLIFDSWTRPTYARMIGVDTITDAEINERFAMYGQFAGLAYWMVVTKPWFDEHRGISIVVEEC